MGRSVPGREMTGGPKAMPAVTNLTRPESLASVRLACDRPKGDRLYRLVLLSPLFLTEAFTRESFLGTTPFPGLHEIAVLLDFLDDVFGLHFSLEAPESVLQ